ncbi:predicted protein [Botrytis cinerea T4]|uniref:Uncharacterized protein n=1 Tax=Botryotinia fuckeliana (strain T4) TaxID=999810 RepID=G2XXQ9_BOTF4|nr:predicted protein [Botrytis cinerea T4]
MIKIEYYSAKSHVDGESRSISFCCISEKLFGLCSSILPFGIQNFENSIGWE